MKLAPLPIAIAVIVAVGLAGAAYVVFSGGGNEPAAGVARYAVGELADLEVREDAPAQPTKFFRDMEGTQFTLADFRGKPILVNLWATWCAPCVRELPALDRLNAEYGGEDFEVIAITLDRDVEAAKTFYAEHGIAALTFYSDPSMQLGSELETPGLPVTVLYDAEGREAARLTKDAEWDGPDAEALVRFAVAGLEEPAS